MWKPVEAPGEWLVFLQRKDIKGLPIMEAKKKYMQEQLLFEAYENNLNTVNTVNTTTSAPASAAAGGGGQRKFKYDAQYKLTYRGTGDTPQKAGVYDRVAISDLKRYWYDNFFDERSGFSVPPPSIPSNIGSDYFFIKENVDIMGLGTVSLITWGSLGSGRQRGQWTYSEYNYSIKTPIECSEYYNKWLNGFGFGSSNLSTPTGKWKINSFAGSKYCITTSYPYELTEVKPVKPGTLPETIDFARNDRADGVYDGEYSRNGFDGNGNPRWTRIYSDPRGGTYNINLYYSTDCGGWKVDRENIRILCTDKIKAGSTVEEGPLGTYTAQDNTTIPPGTITYTAIEAAPPPPPPKGSLTVTGGSSSDTDYIGNYIKDPSSGTGQDAVYIREDNQRQIHYVASCAMWRLDGTGLIKLICETWTGNPTGTSPLGTYQFSAVRAPATGTYTVTQN
jgi:hypothetical protein